MSIDKSVPWFYLSYASDEDGFKGGCYVQANPEVDNPITALMCGSDPFLLAVREAKRLKISPGGQVRGAGPLSQEAMDANVPESLRNRLIGKKEMIEEQNAVHFDGTPAQLGKRSEYAD